MKEESIGKLTNYSDSEMDLRSMKTESSEPAVEIAITKETIQRKRWSREGRKKNQLERRQSP